MSFTEALKLAGLDADSTPQGRREKKKKQNTYYDKRWGEGSCYTSVQFQRSLFSMHVCLAVCAWETSEIREDDEKMLWSKGGMQKGIRFHQLGSNSTLISYTCSPSSYFPWSPRGDGWTSSLEQALILNSQNLQKAGQKVFLLEKLSSSYHLNLWDVRWEREKSYTACLAAWGLK